MPEGTGEVLELLIQLLVVLALIGWAYNRGFRPVERGPLIRLPLLIPAYGLALIVHSFEGAIWQPLVIAVAIIIAGFFGRFNQGRGMAVPVMLVATLLGFNLELSAGALTVVATGVYLLSPVKQR